MIYIEKDDVPYVLVDSKESFTFLLNTISLHLPEHADVRHLIRTGHVCLTIDELNKIEHILEVEGLLFTEFSYSFRKFVEMVENHYNVRIYRGEDNEHI